MLYVYQGSRGTKMGTSRYHESSTVHVLRMWHLSIPCWAELRGPSALLSVRICLAGAPSSIATLHFSSKYWLFQYSSHLNKRYTPQPQICPRAMQKQLPAASLQTEHNEYKQLHILVCFLRNEIYLTVQCRLAYYTQPQRL